jgi:hypothetical protein
MRVVWVRPLSVGHVIAAMYAVLGLVAFVTFAASDMPFITLPLGFVFFIFHLNLNLNFQRPHDPIMAVILCGGTMASYAVSGWITGITATLVFNAVLEKMGGADAKYFRTVDAAPKEHSLETPSPSSTTLQ